MVYKLFYVAILCIMLYIYSVSQNKTFQRENVDINIMQEYFIQNFPCLFSTYFFTSLFNFTQLT